MTYNLHDLDAMLAAGENIETLARNEEDLGRLRRYRDWYDNPAFVPLLTQEEIDAQCKPRARRLPWFAMAVVALAVLVASAVPATQAATTPPLVPCTTDEDCARKNPHLDKE